MRANQVVGDTQGVIDPGVASLTGQGALELDDGKVVFLERDVGLAKHIPRFDVVRRNLDYGLVYVFGPFELAQLNQDFGE